MKDLYKYSWILHDILSSLSLFYDRVLSAFALSFIPYTSPLILKRLITCDMKTLSEKIKAKAKNHHIYFNKSKEEEQLHKDHRSWKYFSECVVIILNLSSTLHGL